jgi:hypothetical protein
MAYRSLLGSLLFSLCMAASAQSAADTLDAAQENLRAALTKYRDVHRQFCPTDQAACLTAEVGNTELALLNLEIAARNAYPNPTSDRARRALADLKELAEKTRRQVDDLSDELKR